MHSSYIPFQPNKHVAPFHVWTINRMRPLMCLVCPSSFLGFPSPPKKAYINCDGWGLDPGTGVDKAACFLTNRTRKSHHGWTLNSKIHYLNNVLWIIASCFLVCSDNRPSSWKDYLNKKSSSAVLAKYKMKSKGWPKWPNLGCRSIEQKVDIYIYMRSRFL